MDFWTSFEDLIEVKIPECVKVILNACGYNSSLSIECLNQSSVIEMENFVNNNLLSYFRNTIEEISCCHRDIYRSLIAENRFRFLPGHRAFILEMCKRYSTNKNRNKNANEIIATSAATVTSASTSEGTLYSSLLSELIKMANVNSGKLPNSKRYSNIIQYFAMFMYMVCGKYSYEIICNNLPMPAPSTVLGYIQGNKAQVIEGQLRCEDLKNYLIKIKAPLCVWLSEDGSGIIRKVNFDSGSNQLVGLTLPIDELTGMPKLQAYPANSLEEIEKYMKNTKSTLIYMVMAQPVKAKSPPFVLQIFGTDNKFKRTDVLNRWKFTKDELKKVGIDVLGISSDGDSRSLGAMKTEANFNLNPLVEEEFKLIGAISSIFIQDPTHIGTKLRNRLLKSSILLPFGSKAISLTHLKLLLQNVPKDIHGLVPSDILPEDRQNFKSLEKIMENRVIEALKKYVLDSDATIEYLKICRSATSCCMDQKLQPLERIFYIWRTVFVLRIWADYLEQSGSYSVDKNFISQNAYDCIEVNAICLTRLVINLRNHDKSDMFMPHLYDSQPCERTFRQLRSMGTINWTKINFSLLELIHLIERIELQNDIVYEKLANVVRFPRVPIDQQELKDAEHFKLPSDPDIFMAIKSALDDAVQITSKFGMNFDQNNIPKCRSRMPHVARHNFKSNDGSESDTTASASDDELDDGYAESIMNRTEELNLRTYNDAINDEVLLSENSKYIKLNESDGSSKVVLKSSIVWLLSESRDKLSSDRLKRVQGTQPQKIKIKRQKISQNTEADAFFKSDEICIGDWCVFRLDNTSSNTCKPNITLPAESAIGNVLIGSVLAFRFCTGKTEKDRQYHHDFVKIETQNIEVLSTWYTVDINGILQSLSINSNFFVDLQNYVATTTIPVFDENIQSLSLTRNTKGNISQCILNFMK